MKLIPHTFNQYELTDEESKSGHILTESNKAVIQNLIAAAANSKINLVLDTKDLNGYMQQESFLKGQIEILTYLLDMHDMQFQSIQTTLEFN